VVLGRINLATLAGERIHVDTVIIHPLFNASTQDNDLALLHLTQAPASSTATAVTLIAQGDPQGLAAAGKTASIIGWGQLTETGPVSPTLQAATVAIVPQDTLRQDYAGETVTDNMLGAASPGKDSCQGDSGGPLLVRTGADTGWVQAGIVSWGVGCAEANFPGVYTRLSNYTNWVNATTSSTLPATASATSVNGTGAIAVSTSAGTLSGVVGLSDSDSSVRQAGRPRDYAFPDGLVSYQVVGLSTGASVTATIRFPSGVPSGWKVYKATSGGFTDFSGHASQSGDAIVLALTDGGTGDSDGAANGTITDPVGLAEPSATTSPTSTPSASTSSGSGGGGGGCAYLPAGDGGFELAALLLARAGLMIGNRLRRKFLTR
jgi:hypothetical protein